MILDGKTEMQEKVKQELNTLMTIITCGEVYSLVTQPCLTLCSPMDCSTPGFPVHHQLPELAQTHVHLVSDAIQPSHPLSFPSPPTFKSFPALGSFPVSQFFTSDSQGVGASASASVLPKNTQD